MQTLKRHKTRIYMIIIILLFQVALPMLTAMVENSYALTTEEETMTEQQKAVVEVAEAYLNKGDAFQYDTVCNTMYINSNNEITGWGYDYRRNQYSSPEMGTVEEPVFLDCSSYVFAVFKETFGLETYTLTKTMMESVEKEIEKENYDYVPYYEVISAETDLEELRDILQIGDAIVYRRADGSGHIVLYIGNDTIIHSRGNYYNYNTLKDNYEDNGTIRKDNINILLKDDGSDYFKAVDSEGEFVVKKVAIFRPLSEQGLKTAGILAEDESLGLTDATKTRMEYPGMVIEKKSSLATKSTASLGEEITFTIEIINNSNEDYLNLHVEDYIPECTSYKSNSINKNGSIEDGTIEWNIEKLEANNSIKLSFAIVVDNDNNNIGKEIVSKAKVGNIETNEITYQIGNKLTQDEKNAILQTAYAYYNKSQESAITYSESADIQDTEMTKIPEKATEENPISLTSCGFINSVYYNALGINLDLSYTNDILDSFFEEYEVVGQSQMYRIKEPTLDNSLRQMLVSDLCGGIRVIERTKWSEVLADYLVKSRGVYERNLEIGDLIVYGFDSTEEANIYIYLGDSKLMIMSSEGVAVLTGSQGKAEIESLLGRSKFVVLRPSLVFSERNITEKAQERIESPIVGYSEFVEEDDSYGNVINRIANRFYRNNTIVYSTENRNLETTIENVKATDNIGLIYSIYSQGFGIKLPNTKDKIIAESDMLILQYNQNLEAPIYSNTPKRGSNYLIYSNDLKRGDILIYKYENEDYFASINLGTYKILTFSEQQGMELERLYTDFLYKIRPAYQENTLEEFYIIRPSLVYDLDLDNDLEVDLNYSTKEITNKDVIVNISSNSNRGIREIEGWTLSKDGTELTKTFNSNTSEEITVYDFGGNEATITLKISNIFELEIENFEEKEESEIKYLTEINSQTTITEMIENIKTNGEVKTYKGETEITDNTEKLMTGMEIKITAGEIEEKYIVVVTGDVNGDGDINIRDILAINKHRLNKTPLTGAYLLAGDITEDGEANIRDILQINKYRLGKIENL